MKPAFPAYLQFVTNIYLSSCYIIYEILAIISAAEITYSFGVGAA